MKLGVLYIICGVIFILGTIAIWLFSYIFPDDTPSLASIIGRSVLSLLLASWALPMGIARIRYCRKTKA